MAKKQPRPRLKVGDKVKVLKKVPAIVEKFAGRVGKVTESPWSKGATWHVDFPGNTHGDNFFRKELKLIPRKKKKK